ncbi:MAG: hypothetical protein ACLQIB_57490 [Isosphaeraceae bacterium]
MDFRQTLSAELPPPRDGEPPSVRQDILDELTDHLACAYKRELLRGADANAAQARVLEQFGDPAAVARRLWFEAMKGKIMTQRVLIGTCLLLLVVVCGAALALVRQQSVRAERQVAEANAQLAQALAQAQATNQEMLKQLRTMAEAFRPGQTPDWIPVSFKLTQETLDGPPAVGYEVALGRGTQARPIGMGGMGGFAGGLGGGFGAMGTADSPYTHVIQRVSDENGLVDFGVVQPGDWQFDLVRRWKGPNLWRAHDSLNVLPGVKIVRSIICPKAPPDTGQVALNVAWPADLAAKKYLVEASFTHAGATYQAPLHWTLGGPNLGWSSGATRSILCGLRAGGINQAEVPTARRSLYFWRFAGPGERGGGDLGDLKSDPTHLYADLLRWDDAGPEPGDVKLDTGKYSLTRLVVLRSRPPQTISARLNGVKVEGERFDVLAYTAMGPMYWANDLGINVVAKPPDENDPAYSQGQMGMGAAGGMLQGQNQSAAMSKFVAVSESFWQGTDAHFEVESGKLNAWTIQLPDEIIKAVREELKGGQSAKAKAG